MKCQNFAGREYVVGLVWAPLPGDNIAIEARDISRERKLKFGVVREQALQVGMTDDKRASGKPSAAALLAETHATAIAIVEIDLDHYWLCAVAQHAVVRIRGELEDVGGEPVLIAAALLGRHRLVGGEVPLADIGGVVARVAEVMGERALAGG